MARAMDFNQVQNSFWDITLRDKDRTVVHLDVPTEALVNKLQNMGAELESMKTGSREGIKEIYTFGAELISCNLDFFKVTPEELETKYDMNLVVMMQFFMGYMQNIDEFQNQKN